MCAGDSQGYPQVPPNKARSTNLEPMEVKPASESLIAYKGYGNGYPKKLSKAERLVMAAQLKLDAEVLSQQGDKKGATSLMIRASEYELGVGYGPYKKQETKP